MESFPPVLAGCLCRFLRHYLLVLLFVFAGKREMCLRKLQVVRWEAHVLETGSDPIVTVYRGRLKTYCLNSASAISSSTMVLFLFFLGIRE